MSPGTAYHTTSPNHTVTSQNVPCFHVVVVVVVVVFWIPFAVAVVVAAAVVYVVVASREHDICSWQLATCYILVELVVRNP